MGLGAHRKAIQRDCGRVRGFTLPGVIARLGEALKRDRRGREGKKKRTKKGRRHVAPLEEYPGKN